MSIRLTGRYKLDRNDLVVFHLSLQLRRIQMELLIFSCPIQSNGLYYAALTNNSSSRFVSVPFFMPLRLVSKFEVVPDRTLTWIVEACPTSTGGRANYMYVMYAPNLSCSACVTFMLYGYLIHTRQVLHPM